MSESFQQPFLDFWQKLVGMLPNLLAAVLFFLFFALIGFFIGKFFARSRRERWKDPIIAQFAGRTLKWIFYLIGLIAALHTLGLGGMANSLIAGAGVSAIIVGFAFKDIAENFLAGILLAVNRPFNLGNIIQVGEFKGAVRNMNLRTTHVRNIEGKDIYIPNSLIVKSVLTNYTKDGLLRQDFTLGLDLPTDLHKVRRIVLDYLRAQPLVLKKPEPDLIVQDLGEFTLNVSVLFWVDVLKNRSISPSYLGATIRSQIIDEIRERLLEKGINMPSQVLEHKLYDPSKPLRIRTEK